jgi:hypothetical protein
MCFHARVGTSYQLLTSSQPTRHRRATGAAGRGRDKAADREKDAQKADELVILSELRNTNALAAKRYLEWLVVGRGLGRGGKETAEEVEFEELVWNCVEEVLEYVGNEGVGKLWRAKGSSTNRCAELRCDRELIYALRLLQRRRMPLPQAPRLRRLHRLHLHQSRIHHLHPFTYLRNHRYAHLSCLISPRRPPTLHQSVRA